MPLVSSMRTFLMSTQSITGSVTTFLQLSTSIWKAKLLIRLLHKLIWRQRLFTELVDLDVMMIGWHFSFQKSTVILVFNHASLARTTKGGTSSRHVSSFC